MTYMSDGVFNAFILLLSEPKTGITLSNFKCSHLSCSLVQVSSATFFGAITNTLFT